MKKVAIIIPTYNRGHLLEKTIPSYAEQIGKNFFVKEIIIVDDCSVDNTTNVIKKLKESYPMIKYYKLEKNSKQQVAKNKGIELLGKEIDYVYFGDDDAILIPNSINYLIETLEKYKADVVGARALWAKKNEDIKNYNNFIHKGRKALNLEVVDFEKDIFNFDIEYMQPLEVPVTHSYFLIKKECIGNIKFDTRYKGNCYREETDFLLTINKAGKKLFYDSRAVGINFPRYIATGGAHKKGIIGKLKWEYWAIKNNNIFLDKWYVFLKNQKLIKKPKLYLKFYFLHCEIKRKYKGILRRIGI